jgi:hypothetical protein
MLVVTVTPIGIAPKTTPRYRERERERERGEDHGRKPGASSPGGAYVNFMMDEGNERVQATYRGNYSRLRETKRTYDPKNVFRINQNIPPAG